MVHQTNHAGPISALAFCLGCIGLTVALAFIPEPNDIERNAACVLLSAFAGSAFGLFIRGPIAVVVGDSRSAWSVSAKAGAAAFVLVFLVLHHTGAQPALPAAAISTLRPVNITGRVHIAQKEPGSVVLSFAPGRNFETLPDGQFAINSLTMPPDLTVLVTRQSQTFHCQVHRPRGAARIHLDLDLAGDSCKA